jgi:hypothetical protein
MFAAQKEMKSSRKKAAIAGNFARNGEAQTQAASASIGGAKAGTELANVSGLGQEINALALPLDSMGQQFEQKMVEMGVGVDEAKAKWKELFDEISSGEVTAGDAISQINSTLSTEAQKATAAGQPVSASAASLQVTQSMQLDSRAMVDPNGAQRQADFAGQMALSSPNAVGGDMANTLAYSELG